MVLYGTVYLLTGKANHKNQPNVGKHTSPMDLMGYTTLVHEINTISSQLLNNGANENM